ncbi:TIGR01212 family radical SAM protein [Halosquirtibacter xylanolyticus]|uniref:TIGR01212 family radical SAM protein n=1 Tax=Halosquirtibacter xylanolyticus TaxID=3374599 RepID=UPI00374A2C3C|nr:TIGR01212 family radical SAM protein [Prolixibacteraceae bacterium]
MSNTYNWGHPKRYNDFSTHFKRMFERRVQKVSIDAGFTCPNRDGTKARGGCTYCNNDTFTPSYTNLKVPITTQIDQGVEFFKKKYNAISFLAYFQAFSNTYAPFDVLKRFYEEALSHPDVIGLVIATRPDCLSAEILDYLAELSKKCYIMVELGVESTNNSTLEFINRGHTHEETLEAIQALHERGIHNCIHTILGLPGEDKEMLLEQARVISELPIENLKLHQLQIHKGTKMFRQYRENPELFSLYSAEEYMDLVIAYLEILNPNIIVERFISTAPPELLVAPKWGLKNFEFVAKLEKKLEANDTYQGRLYTK